MQRLAPYAPPSHCWVASSLPPNFTGSVHLYSRSKAAMKQFLNLGQHPQQHFAVKYANTIHDTLTAHPNLSLSIHHSKQHMTHIRFKHMQHLLLETIKHHLIDDSHSLKSIDYQKRESKANVLWAWEQQFYNYLCSSQIYNSILTGLPDGKLPMVLQITSLSYHTKDQTYKHQVP